MTIIVGVLCKDGVVIGADSAATFATASGQIRTIEQPTKKVYLLCDDHVILAGTGQIGMGQRFASIVEGFWAKKIFAKPENTPTHLGSMLAEVTTKNFQATSANVKEYGALLAFPCHGKAHLCEFACGDFQPELKTQDIWYVSMGSGQLIVDPFLALIRKVFWDDGMPNCQDAVFAVYWAISHAIDVNPGGVNKPVSIGVLRNGVNAVLLPEEDLEAHNENVNGAIRHLRKYKDILQGKGDAPTPQIPAKPV